MVLPLLSKCSATYNNSPNALLNSFHTPFNMLCSDMLEKILGYLDDEDTMDSSNM